MNNNIYADLGRLIYKWAERKHNVKTISNIKELERCIRELETIVAKHLEK